MEDSRRLDPRTLDAILDEVLAAHPDATIAVISPEAGLCPIPEGMDVGSRRVIEGASALEFVRPENRATVVTAWRRTAEVGATRTVLPGADGAGDEIVLHLIDATHRFGVYVALVEGNDPVPVVSHREELDRAPTKMGRIRMNAVSVIVEVDDATVEMLGFEPHEVIGRPSLDFIHADDHARAVECWMSLLGEPGGNRSVRTRHRRSDGSYIWVEIAHRNLLAHEERCVLVDIIDISEEMAAHEAVRAREQILARLTDALPLGVLHIDIDRNVVFVNRRFFEITGIEESEDGTLDLQRHLEAILTADRETLEAALDDVLARGVDRDVRLRVRRLGQSEIRLLQVAFRSLTAEDGQVTGAIACVEDVTEQVRLQIELENRATRDDLTGTFNRSSTLAALEELLASDLHARSGTALIFVDVDDFKQANDGFGHAAGDAVLRTVAERAERVVRHADLIGRVGGDEFLILCPGMSDEDAVMAIATRVGEEVNQPVQWGSQEIAVQISIGVVWCDATDVDAEWLVAEADRMMYESKRDGSGAPLGRPARIRLAS